MISKTLTNEISININYSKLLEKYNIYKIKNDSNTQREYQEFHKKVRTELKPLASTRDRGYTLIAYPLNQEIHLNSKYEIKKLMFAELKREKHYILINLINSLLANESNYFGIESDPYGLYYLVKSTKSKLISIKIYIDKNMHISLNVVTFIKSFNKKDEELYILKENKIVRVLDRKKDEIYYVKGSYSGSKSIYPFLGLQLNYKESKVYVLSKYTESINRYFNDIVSIDFIQKDMMLYDGGANIDSRKQELKNEIISFIKFKKQIHISNYTSENLNKEIEKLKKLIFDYIGLDISITNSNKIISEGLNFTITRDKEYYNKNKIDDPYKNIKVLDKSTQNFTIETLREIISSKNKLIHVLLKECIIKNEIQERRINLPYNKVPDGFTFIYPKKDKEQNLFYKLKFTEQKMIFENLSEKEKQICEEILMTSPVTQKVETIIFDKDENISYTLKTNGFVLPKFKLINSLLKTYEEPLYMSCKEVLNIWENVYANKEEDKKEKLNQKLSITKNIHNDMVDILKLNINGVQKFKNIISKKIGRNVTFNLRRNEYRHIIDSLIGIRFKEYDDHVEYVVGNERNLDKIITKASIIRELHHYKGKILAEDILGMMSEYFVKNGSFTVLPYPMKYLREYYNQ